METTIQLSEVEVIKNDAHPNFIEANTQEVSFLDLAKDYVPSFGDSSLTIPHCSFINTVKDSATKIFGELSDVEIRVSHPIVGRKPEAIYKSKDELVEDDTTIFFQRMCFLFRCKNVQREINGQTVNLVVGGVRSYHEDKLYGKKTPEKFTIFAGYFLRVCSNGMITGDGNSGVFEALSTSDITEKAINLFVSYNEKRERELQLLQDLWNVKLTESDVCKIFGRLRLYDALSPQERRELGLPNIEFGDQVARVAIRNYLYNENFGRTVGDLNCWNLMQWFNEGAKGSYINDWITRNQNCTDLAIGISQAKRKVQTPYSWFLL